MPVARRGPKPLPPPPAVAPLSLASPGAVLALSVAAACLVVSASYRLYDTDLWQHLAMGRAMWATHGIPRTNLWTWPQYGEPYYISSWGFRALVWPLWSGGGIGALYAWRWLTTLAVFGLLLATARAMGAGGLGAILVMVWCSLDYRLRTDVRPETLAAVLLALELWLLERHRLGSGGEAASRRRVWWLVAVAWAWANLHISYYLGFVLLGFYLADAQVAGLGRGAHRDPARARARQLWRVAAASLAVSFLNPWGWTTLWQPFEFALRWGNDPLVRTIAELQPLPWPTALQGGRVVWPLLLVWRAWRRGPDVVETLSAVFFTAMALSSLRFVATYSLIAAPFVARDLHDLLASRRWPVPRWPLLGRAALCGLASVAICVPDWIRPDLPLGIGYDPVAVPEKACDFMAAHRIRGRGFNPSHFGGYLPYRFWPERERLPFISTQPEYTPAADRLLYLRALVSEEGWRELDAKYHFDYALLGREQVGRDSLLDFLDRDPRWALVFSDDAAQLLVRRDGPLSAVADSYAYAIVPAGRAGRYRLGAAGARDPGFRRRAEAELDRMIASSPHNGGASHLRGWFALMDGDGATARRDLERALALDPRIPGVHDMLGMLAVAQGRPHDAVREFDLERRFHAPPPGIFFRTAVAWRQLGDVARARAFYRRELERDPGHRASRDSLAALEARR